MKSEPDTVCALATPPGIGSIAVIRLSGPRTFDILDQITRGMKPSRQPSGTVRLGWVEDSNRREIDHVMISVFRTPKSYTGEDLAEISCHGNQLIADTIIKLLRQHGCRLAEPGEFTRRAVLAGKLTLSQAEAVLDLIHAQTTAALRSALNRYEGGISKLVTQLAEELRNLVADAEYQLGFDEPDTQPLNLAKRVKQLTRKLDRIITRGKQNQYVYKGAEVAIVGRPNVGKSSLFNRLLGQKRAVVTPAPGTTRDRIDASIVLGDAQIKLTDTGGITGRSAGTISRPAAAQTCKAIEQSDLVLMVFDGSRPAASADQEVFKATSRHRVIYIINKSDKPRRFEPDFLNGNPGIAVSALTGTGIGRLRSMIARRFRLNLGTVVTSTRHLELLEECRTALNHSRKAPDAETSAFELKAALDALGKIDAPCTSTDILNRVFSRFCVGK